MSVLGVPGWVNWIGKRLVESRRMLPAGLCLTLTDPMRCNVLRLARKVNEEIVIAGIGWEVRVRLCDVSFGRAGLGVTAPREIAVFRAEVPRDVLPFDEAPLAKQMRRLKPTG